MAGKRPTTVAEYIRSAPPESQPHLRRLHAILKKAAPRAREVIKWGNPFFVEPRFVFAFSAHRAHCNLAATAEALEPFREQLKRYKTTKNFLQIPYNEPFPADLVRRIAEYRVRNLGEEEGFW